MRLPSHGGNRGSIPLGRTNLSKHRQHWSDAQPRLPIRDGTCQECMFQLISMDDENCRAEPK
ncbi:hypothetical protein GCM10023067_30410 [Aminobacter aganoensis]